MIVFANSGFMSGLSIANVIVARWQITIAHGVIAALVGAAAAANIVIMFRSWFDLRRMKRDLEQQRQTILLMTRSELTRMFPDDPVYVAKVMLDLQEGVLKPL